jgi:ParB/RepB/Spo0J family partition protein
MSVTVAAQPHVSVDLIDLGKNVREIDQDHVKRLSRSIALRGMIVPLPVRRVGDRYQLVAGDHRFLAARDAGLTEVAVTPREAEGTSADSAAENILRKQLTPVEEARAVKAMLDEGYTLDGAAEALGWSRQLVGARVKILDLPETAHAMIDSGLLPVGMVAMLLTVQSVSPRLCEAALELAQQDDRNAYNFVHSPGWFLGRVSAPGLFSVRLDAVSPEEIEQLRLGKKAQAQVAEAEKVHKAVNRHAYGPPTFRFTDLEVDQARAAGVLIELEDSAPIIVDRPLYRELVKQVIARTLQDLQSIQKDAAAARKHASRGEKPTPEKQAEAENRGRLRTIKAQAHGVNLDLGAKLLKDLASVDPANMDVARFFAYGVLADDKIVRSLAASGIRLVVEEHRTTVRPKLKNGGWGKTKVTYHEPDHAEAWLWKFLEGAKTASELYGRALVVFAAQHYAHQLVLPASQQQHSQLPRTHKDTARKAFERLTKDVLPGSHVQLRRAIEKAARDYKRELAQARKPAETGEPTDLPQAA